MFDKAADYDSLLAHGLKLSGEDKDYFIQGRVAILKQLLQARRLSPKSILDYGCGTGLTTSHLANVFGVEVQGVDTSVESISLARKLDHSGAVAFSTVDRAPSKQFDLCYVNGVFHHIPPRERLESLSFIRNSLTNNGVFAFFENNPWNPGTRWIMSRIPFDKDAITLSYVQARRLLNEADFELIMPPQFLFYFPAFLAFLRPLEPYFKRVPLGAQYLLLAKKRSASNAAQR